MITVRGAVGVVSTKRVATWRYRTGQHATEDNQSDGRHPIADKQVQLAASRLEVDRRQKTRQIALEFGTSDFSDFHSTEGIFGMRQIAHLRTHTDAQMWRRYATANLKLERYFRDRKSERRPSNSYEGTFDLFSFVYLLTVHWSRETKEKIDVTVD